MTSLAASSLKYPEKLSKLPLGLFWVVFLQNGLSNEREIFTNLATTTSLTKLPDLTSLAASSRLKNAIQYFTKVHKIAKFVRSANSRIIQPLCNVESPYFTQTSMLVRSMATSQVMSSATSGLHLLTFEKAVENAGSNFSCVPFCLPQPIGGLRVLGCC